MEVIEKKYEEFIKTNIVENKKLIQYRDNNQLAIIPEGIEYISNDAFRNNNGIGAVVLPNTIKEIQDGFIKEAITEEEQDEFLGAFSGSINLIEVIIPKKLKRIPACCFAYCSSLKRITLPQSIIDIEKMAFYGCTNLEKVILPSNVKTIQMYAFYNCQSVKYIYIPKSVKYIGKYAFSGLSGNQTIIFEGSEKDTDFFHVGWNSGFDGKIIWNYKPNKN